MAKITSNEYVKIAWVPLAYMTSEQASAVPVSILNAPTTIQLNSAAAWADFTLGATDSDDVEDRGLDDPGNAVTRGFSNYEATLSFFRDANQSDTASDYVKAFETFRVPRTYGYLVIRVAEKKSNEPWAAGDRVSVFKFIADVVTDDTEGDDSVKFTVNYLPQGLMFPYTFVSGAGATLTAPATLAVAAGEHKVIEPVTIAGKDARAVADYRSSSSAVATVSTNGVVTGVSAGTANISVTHPISGTAATVAVTVS